MTDNELRGIILEKYYANRHKHFVQIDLEPFDPPISSNDIRRISQQLEEHGLVEIVSCTVGPGNPATWEVHGAITANGVDVVERTVTPPISIIFDLGHHVSVVNSSNTQIGDRNVHSVSIDFEVEKIIAAIDHSAASDAEKKEAKTLLKRFLEHPLVTSIAGGIASSFSP